MFQAFIIYYTCVHMFCTDGAANKYGQEYGFWMAGQIAYGCIIIKVNAVLLVKSYMHFWLNILLVALMILSYYVFFGLMAATAHVPTMYCLFSQALGQPIAQVVMAFNLALAVAIELAFKLTMKIREIDADVANPRVKAYSTHEARMMEIKDMLKDGKVNLQGGPF